MNIDETVRNIDAAATIHAAKQRGEMNPHSKGTPEMTDKVERQFRASYLNGAATAIAMLPATGENRDLLGRLNDLARKAAAGQD